MTTESLREIRLAIADQIAGLEYDELRGLAQSAQRQLMSDSAGGETIWSLLHAGPQSKLLAETGDERGADFEATNDLARRQMATRLKEFPRLRSDNTFKTAINAALRNVVFALVLADRISAADSNGLTAPWRNATGWPTERND